MNAPTEAAANAAHTDRVANDGMVVELMADADAMLSAPAVSKAVAAMKPTSMKTPVYAMDRGDRRALPQMPWPDVHPLPIAEPAPTRERARGGDVESPRGEEAAEEGEVPGEELALRGPL